MSARPPSRRPVTWRHVLSAGWVVFIAVLYFLRQVPPQWPKIYERFIAPLLGR